jgi:chromosome segregation protein
LTTLLAQSGLAERTYTIIGQGLIDQALSLRADERRALFEEAAGITHYKNRRAETLRRLEETRRNLERVNDILTEIKPRLNSLRRQANRAQNYEHVAADLRHHLRTWYGYQWEKVRKEVRTKRFDSEELGKEWEAARRQLLILQDSLEVQRKQAVRLDRQLIETEEFRENARRNYEERRRQVAILEERLTQLDEQRKQNDSEIPNLESQRDAASLELQEAISQLNEAQANLEQEKNEVRLFESSTGGLFNQSRQLREDVSNFETEKSQYLEALALAKGKLAQMQQRQLELDMLDKGDAELSQSEIEIQKQIQNLERANANLEELRTKRDRLTQLIGARNHEIDKLKLQIAERESQLLELRGRVARLQGQWKHLNQLKSEQQNQEFHSTVHLTRLLDKIRTPSSYRVAVESAITYRLNALLIADEDNLWQLDKAAGPMRYVAAVKGAISPPSSLPLPDDDKVVGWASELLETDDETHDLVKLLLGRVLIVEDAMTAYKLAHELPSGSVAATIEGFVAHAGGLVEKNLTNTESSILNLEQERQNTKKELDSFLQAMENSQAQLEELQTKFQQIEKDATARENELNRLNQLFQDAKLNAGTLQHELDLGRQRQALITDKLAERSRESSALTERIELLSVEIAQIEEMVSNSGDALRKAREELGKLPLDESANQRELLQQRLDASVTIVAGRQAVIDSRRATLNQLVDQIARQLRRRQQLHDQINQLDLEGQRVSLKKEKLKLDTLVSELRPHKRQLADTRANLEALEVQLAEHRRRNHDLETSYTEARIKAAESRNHLETIRERITADLGLVALTYDESEASQSPLPMADVVEQLPEVTELPKDIEETIQRYRGQLNRMGSINPDAPAEFKETQARYDFLVQQMNDLENTQNQLRGVIAELDDLTSRAFADTVKRVDAIFGDVFRRLFGGGSAQIVLTQPDDLTITGVDIIARLPRRREQGLALLSGGERSLTAAALVFALLKVSPTPFCVLDEVDAMLDEANVNRFRDMLDELSQQTQFIVITHNRGTVQAAESVYGVSIGSDSTSQVISIRPEDYVNGQNAA